LLPSTITDRIVVLFIAGDVFSFQELALFRFHVIGCHYTDNLYHFLAYFLVLKKSAFECLNQSFENWYVYHGI
jgi:hypothetical protein